MVVIFAAAVLLSIVQSVVGHNSHRNIARQASTISRSFTGAPYPTGPGFDVPQLADITQSSTPEPTVALPAVFPAGTTPLPLGNDAPGLPDISSFDSSVFPPLDKVPPTDSPEVQAWLAEIEGVDIPNLSPTKDGTCESDPEAAAQADANGRCWWTCTGCVRDTDVVGCPDKERWGLTFDDGPSEYTPKLLNYLQSIDTQATFYTVGSRVISSPETVQTQLMLGHEISVHTYSHPALTTLTNEQIVAELGWSRKAIKDVTGVTPLTFRPPFGDIDDRVRAIANAMNLTPVIWSNVGAGKADTEDFEVPDGVALAADTVIQFRNTLGIVEGTFNTGIITLEHDLFQETVDIAIGSTLPDALSRPGPEQRGWTLGTVAQCRGQRAGDAYQETTTNQTVLARLGRAPSASATSPIPSTPTTTAISSAVFTGATSEGVPSGASEGTKTSTVSSGLGLTLISSSATITTIGAAPTYVTPIDSVVEIPSSSLGGGLPLAQSNGDPATTELSDQVPPASNSGAYAEGSTSLAEANGAIQSPFVPALEANPTSPLGASVSASSTSALSFSTTSVANGDSNLSYDIKGAASINLVAKSGHVIASLAVLVVAWL